MTFYSNQILNLTNESDLNINLTQKKQQFYQ
jgi:hypothetical protein